MNSGSFHLNFNGFNNLAFSFLHSNKKLVSLLSVCGAGGITCMLVDIPLVQVCSFITLMCCGMAVNIVNAATVDLYPTSSRYLATFEH